MGSGSNLRPGMLFRNNTSGPVSKHLSLFGMITKVLKDIPQCLSVALGEGQSAAIRHIHAFSYIGGYAATAEVHGFKQCQGHALQRAGEDIYESIAVEFICYHAVLKASKEDGGIVLRHGI